MIVDFKYKKGKIDFLSGYIFKGRNYRCNYIKFASRYDRAKEGTKQVEVYNFNPKGEVRASAIIMQGLGSRNVKFLLWMATHLSSAGISSSVIIPPGNYTRVENGSVSGKNYLWPEIGVMVPIWEHAVVDVMSTIDLLEQQHLWLRNNCIVGYCLGGMISCIVSAIDRRINETILVATGGHMGKIIHESRATKFARNLMEKGYGREDNLNDREKLYGIYEEQMPMINKMSLEELIYNTDIHPILKIDPLAYAHLLQQQRTTLIDALFDETLPMATRRLLFNELKDSKRIIMPFSHGTWLPFEYLLSLYILHRMNVNDRKAKKMLLRNEMPIDLSGDDFLRKVFRKIIPGKND
ncbi:MAG TPA: alpha/beta hydrolase [Thermotogota bacterium]|nr:alpha/beta hydrolase [Thermotogota bacterium]HPJ88705.1 alpha/beta hydrolase [Thermotogota bacterium]